MSTEMHQTEKKYQNDQLPSTYQHQIKLAGSFEPPSTKMHRTHRSKIFRAPRYYYNAPKCTNFRKTGNLNQ